MRGHIVTALIAIAASVAVSTAVIKKTPQPTKVVEVSGKYYWGAMTKTEQVEAARLIGNLDRREVQIFCAAPGCQDLGEDIDEVFDLTGAASNLQRPMFELGAGMGISPDEPATRKIAEAFKTATNGRVDLQVIDQKQDGGGIVIALGRKPRK